MGKIEWAMWANEQGIQGSAILFLGGVLATCSLATESSHANWQIAAYGIGISLLMFSIEYPRSKRVKGRTLQRSNQHILALILSKFGMFAENYFFRFIFYFCASVPTLFNLGTILGGVAMIISSVIYFRAAIAGEKWVRCKKEISRTKTLTRAQPPAAAPPRLNPSAAKTNAAVDDDAADYENFDTSKKQPIEMA